MDWAGEEVRRTANRRRSTTDRVAGYFSGVFFQHGFFSRRADDFAVVPAPEFGTLDLSAYPAIWIPRESDQRTLEANAGRIADYLEAGGRLVCFEEIDRPWLPGTAWAPRQVDLAHAAVTGHPLGKALGDFRRPWHAHGVLQVPSDAHVLISDADGAALLASYAVGKGAVLAGVIDADSHAGYGSSIPDAFIDEVLAWTRAPVPVAAR
jgi:hypothetical protein